MARRARLLYEVCRLESDGTRTIVAEGVTGGEDIRVSGLAPGWYITCIYAPLPDGARSEPSRIPSFVRESGGSLAVGRTQGAGAGSHVR